MIRFLALFVLLFASCSNTPKEKVRLCVGTSWYSLNFGKQNPYVNGFVDELLLEVAKEMRVEFEKIPTNDLKKCDLALSSMPPYTFNKAKYIFTQNILRIGPVLILPTSVKTKKLKDMEGETLGVLAGMDVTLVLQKYPDIIVRNYQTTTELLNAVVAQDVQGALFNRIDAVGFTSGSYNGKLKIASLPLNDEGLHLIAEKGKHEKFVHSFDKNITELKKKKFYRDLLEKWKL